MLTKRALRLFLESGGISLPVNGSEGLVQELMGQKLIATDLSVTETGKLTYDKLIQRLGELKAGVPFEERKIKDPTMVNDVMWESGKYGNNIYISDRNFLTFAKKTKYMKIKESLHEKTAIDGLVKRQSTLAKPAHGVELFPSKWLVIGKFEHDLIVLTDKKEKITRVIDAVYYDFLSDKYATLKFFTAGKDEEEPITISIDGRKVMNGLIAIIAPITML